MTKTEYENEKKSDENDDENDNEEIKNIEKSKNY